MYLSNRQLLLIDSEKGSLHRERSLRMLGRWGRSSRVSIFLENREAGLDSPLVLGTEDR